MQKKNFILLINSIKNQMEVEETVSSNLSKLGIDMMYSGEFIDVILKVLKDEFNDEGDWISWWIYEKKFGTNDKINGFYKNKKEIQLKTAEDLYKLLVKNNKK